MLSMDHGGLPTVKEKIVGVGRVIMVGGKERRELW